MLDQTSARLLRCRTNLLAHPVAGSGPCAVAEVVRRIGGVQAQVSRAAGLAVRARSAGTTATDVEVARVEERAVVRGWYMRGTLHLVATEHSPRILQVLGPPMIAATARRYAELGLDDESCERAINAIENASSRDGPLTRAEIAKLLVDAKLVQDAAGQGVYHLIRRGGLAGRLCYGPDRNGEETWISTAEWLGRRTGVPPPSDDSLRWLAETYLSAYQPAGVDDFAAWSGLSKARARAGLRLVPKLVETSSAAGTLVSLVNLPMVERLEHVRLLPEFDPFLLGYRSREFAVPAEHVKRVHPGGGMLRPVVAVDGNAVATWKWADGRKPRVEVEQFCRLSAAVSADIAREAMDVGRYLGDGDVTLQYASSTLDAR